MRLRESKQKFNYAWSADQLLLPFRKVCACIVATHLLLFSVTSLSCRNRVLPNKQSVAERRRHAIRRCMNSADHPRRGLFRDRVPRTANIILTTQRTSTWKAAAQATVTVVTDTSNVQRVLCNTVCMRRWQTIFYDNGNTAAQFAECPGTKGHRTTCISRRIGLHRHEELECAFLLNVPMLRIEDFSVETDATLHGEFDSARVRACGCHCRAIVYWMQRGDCILTVRSVYRLLTCVIGGSSVHIPCSQHTVLPFPP